MRIVASRPGSAHCRNMLRDRRKFKTRWRLLGARGCRKVVMGSRALASGKNLDYNSRQAVTSSLPDDPPSSVSLGALPASPSEPVSAPPDTKVVVVCSMEIVVDEL